ncbi:MAG: hypothetical protein ACNY01_12415, partial [Desulfobacteria bacterium]
HILRANFGAEKFGQFRRPIPGLLRVAKKTVSNMKERIARLYEQGADTVSIGQYVLRWVRWANAGVVVSFPLLPSRQE